MEKTVNVSGKSTSTFDKLEHTKPYYVLVDEQKPQEDCSIDSVMAGLFYVHANSRVSEVMSLSVEALGPDSVLVQWKGLDLAKTPFVYGFNYQIKEKSGKFSKSGSLPANAMSLTIGGLDAVTEYEVAITTVGIYSRRSSMGSIKTSPGLPSAPQDLTTSLAGTTLTVNWKAPASVPGQLSKYRVALYKNGNIQELKETSDLRATFENVDRNMYYTVKVAAFVESVDGRGGGYGPEVSSGLVIQQPPTPPPLGTPELKSVEAAGSTAVKAVWTEVPQAYGYIFTFASSIKPTVVVVVSSSPTFAILKGLEPGTKYQVTVQAMSIDKTGEKSKAIEVETLGSARMMDPTIQGKKASGKEEGAESLPSFKKSEATFSRTARGNVKRGAKLVKREASASTHPQHVAFGADVFKVPSADQNACGLFNATCTKNATQKLEVPSKGGGGARTIMAVAACVMAAVVLVGLATLTVMRQRPRRGSHATQPLPV
ncbi:unnamed protein product [Mesocestoides corti]|uniref:Fibronectin type-III domain-containing protein n=1 Tax=Mesocestoides corti TaxID=53468 RepID=A0A0R3U1Q5_MESCO|nr:unnamed protein product [Mesocestoides corti]